MILHMPWSLEMASRYSIGSIWNMIGIDMIVVSNEKYYDDGAALLKITFTKHE